jgi:hypothetical protein
MRDGTRIALDIYRPADGARHSALYAAGPFPHTLAILEDSGAEAGPVAWYVSQGFTVVLANVRGTGLSTGEYAYFSRQEQQDHYEIIQWIAAQPWSDGQVAGAGAGYYGASQWQMAIQNPPALECIAPFNGTLDPFREWIAPGGLANTAFIGNWYEERVRLPNAYTPGVSRLVTFDMRLAQLSHPYLDAWWQERSSFDSTRQINVPVFAIHDWRLDLTAPGLASTLSAMDDLNVINKVLVSSPDGELPLYQDTGFLGRELLPYYQWCFSGRNPISSFIEKPRIRYQVRGQNTLKRENNWPPGNITQQPWFLDMRGEITAAGRLAASQTTAGPGFTNVERNDRDAALRFVSERLEQDMEITGPVMLELYAASTTPDMAFEITLREEMVFNAPPVTFRLPAFLAQDAVEPEPAVEASTPILVSRGSLKASARQRENVRSTEYMPVYALTGREILSPGQVYRLDIALRQTAYRFQAGNRIVLEIKPVNDGSLAVTGRDTLYHSTRYPTRLWLPVVRSPRQMTPGQPVQPGASTPGPVSQGEASQNPEIFVPR